ncbi:hypothetical protein GC197_04990 [bacterium]|nr:hypothetical protein [bacterium]
MFHRAFLWAAITASVFSLAFTQSAEARHHHQQTTLTGVVMADDAPVPNVYVELFEAGWGGANLIDSVMADDNGAFSINMNRRSYKDLLYIVASNGAPGQSELVLVAILGQEGKNLSTSVVVNELTTVAAAYACAQFIDGDQIYGFSPGLDNAFDTTTNLVDVQTGLAAAVVSNQNNGSTLTDYPRSTEALLYFNTLANMIAACVEDGSGATYTTLFTLTTPNGSPAPTNTFEAIHNLARNPGSFDNSSLLTLAQTAPLYSPMLIDPPKAWLLILHFTEGGFNGPGRVAIDAWGNVWSNNNFANSPPDDTPGNQVSVLSPLGQPILGSPIINSHVSGSGYGIVIDRYQDCWIGNFANGDISVFSSRGKFLPWRYIPASDIDADPPVKTMGMAFDQKGNLWATNMGDETDPSSAGSITVFLHGNRHHAITFPQGTNDGQTIRKPFSVAIDDQGRAWVANSGFSPVGNVAGSVAVLELTNNKEISVVQLIEGGALTQAIDTSLLRKYGDFASPKTIAIDQDGNGWISNFESHQITFIDGQTFAATDYPADSETHGWGMAVDGSQQIWVASFTNSPVPPENAQLPPSISVLQGAADNRGDLLLAFSNHSFQHITGLQIDASGNVWACNNWTLETTPTDIVGGDGLVQVIGAASPVQTPMIGPPENPEFGRPRFGFHDFGYSKWYHFNYWWNW